MYKNYHDMQQYVQLRRDKNLGRLRDQKTFPLKRKNFEIRKKSRTKNAAEDTIYPSLVQHKS